MAEEWGTKVAKWTKITDAEENQTVDINTDSQGDDRMLVESEQRDLEGSTEHHNGSFATQGLGILVPAVAGNVISEVFIANTSTASSRSLQVSFDGGTNWKTISRNGHLAWSLKGYQTQFRIRTATANTTNYEIVLNKEAF